MTLMNVFRLVTTFGRVISIFDAGRKIHNNLNLPLRRTADNVDLVFQGLFAVAQLGDGIGNGLGVIPRSYLLAKIGLHMGAGIADVARNYTHMHARRWLWFFLPYPIGTLKVATTAAFRAVDTIDFTSQIRFELLNLSLQILLGKTRNPEDFENSKSLMKI